MPISFLSNLGNFNFNPIIEKKERLISIKNNTESTEQINEKFPKNVLFSQENYISEMKNEEKYDTILCMSVVKWIHLNYGDIGVKILFNNIYNQLKPGGIFLFEPQNWKSYKKRKNLSEMIRKNFQEIKFRPEHFNEYLITIYNYELLETIDAPSNSKVSFSRPIYVFRKNN